MEKISEDQRFTLLAAIGMNTDWSKLSIADVQVGIDEAKRAGEEFTRFIKNRFRIVQNSSFVTTESCSITIPALAQPTLDTLRSKYSFIKSIERDTSPVEAVILNLGTVLTTDENSISGSKYESRIMPLPTLGYQQATWLVEHQDEFPEFMTLLGKVYIDFPGLVVLSADGDRDIPCLGQDGRRWGLVWHWIGRAFNRRGRVAVSGK